MFDFNCLSFFKNTVYKLDQYSLSTVSLTKGSSSCVKCELLSRKNPVSAGGLWPWQHFTNRPTPHQSARQSVFNTDEQDPKMLLQGQTICIFNAHRKNQ